MADPIRCVYAMEDGCFCTKHSSAFYDASCRLLDGESCEDQKPPKPMTNGDRIRSMSDEELAEFITPVKCVDCHLLDCGIGEIGNTKTCEERILDWLKEEVSE